MSNSGLLIVKFPLESAWGGEEEIHLLLAKEMRKKGHKVALLTSCPYLYKAFFREGFWSKKLWHFPDPVSIFALVVFPLTAVLFFITGLIFLPYYRARGYKKVLFLRFGEKILWTGIAKILGMQVFWGEHCGFGKWIRKNPLLFLYKFFGRFAEFVVPSEEMQRQVLSLVKEAKINILPNALSENFGDFSKDTSSQVEQKSCSENEEILAESLIRDSASGKIGGERAVKIIGMSGLSGAESQIFSSDLDAVLVGTSIMQSADKKQKIKEFLNPRVLLKICGVRDEKTAEECEKIGVDFVGLNFVPTSKRRIQLGEAKRIRSHLKNTFAVGVFQDQAISEVNHFARELDLDFVQLHGYESVEFMKMVCRPIIRAISINQKEDLIKIEIFAPYADILLFDGKIAGSGQAFAHNLLKNVKIPKPFFVAGGINVQNAQGIVAEMKPCGLDTASGVEEDGVINLKKIRELKNKLL